MKSVTIDHMGKRPFNYDVTKNGDIQIEWINYIDQDGYDYALVKDASEIVKVESISKFKTVIFYN